MKPATIIFLWIFSIVGAFAQNSEETFDVVFLKNGKRHVGHITAYEKGDNLQLETKQGNEITIDDSDILKIMQGINEEELDAAIRSTAASQVFEGRKSGIYNTTMLAFALGQGDGNALSLGAGLSTAFGYQFSPAFGFGVGIGLDNYARRGETVYPIFAEVRGFLPFGKKEHSYYYSLAGGYGMAFKRESIGVREAEGGYMVHPTIGFRTPTREGVDVNVDIGVKLQKASFQHDLFNGDIKVRDLVFQRLTIRVGLTLWK